MSALDDFASAVGERASRLKPSVTLDDILSTIDSYKRKGADVVRSAVDDPMELLARAAANVRSELPQRYTPPEGATTTDIFKHYADPEAVMAGPAGSLAGFVGSIKGSGPPPKGPKKPATPPPEPEPEIPPDPNLGSGPGGQISADDLNAAARSRRRIETTGQFIGAPPGVDTPRKVNKLVNDYVGNIQEALDNGVKRGYFYKEGTDVNRAVADNPSLANKLAMMEGITSSEAPVETNIGWASKGIEQQSMGAPTNTGKYPNVMRPKVDAVLGGDFAHIGEKTHRYAAGLAGDETGKAPNDRWEVETMGYPGKSAPSPTQHDFMDEVRQKAIDRWNAMNPTEEPLSTLEGQELNWATQRAKALGIPHVEAAESLKPALESHTVQHSWESRGGQEAEHLQKMSPEEWDAYHQRIADILLDPKTGKDELIAALGGRLQFPAFHGPGVFEGVVAPGTQSRSVGYLTDERGLDPVTTGRVTGTEAARAYGLGQDALAAHGFTSPKNISGPGTDTVQFNFGRRPSNAEALDIQNNLDRAFGPGNTGVVPVEPGFRVLNFGDDKNFGRDMKSYVSPTIIKELGAEAVPGSRFGGIYKRMGWGGREEGPNPSPATKTLLEAIDNPLTPRLAGLADSPRTRSIMLKLADQYELERAAGFAPNEKLINALRVWGHGGLGALRSLAAKGLAPAAGGIALSELLGRPDERQGVQ